MLTPCIFCGGDRSAPDHAQRCDGRQGAVEAAAEAYFDAAEAARRAEAGIRQSYDAAREHDKTVAREVIRACAYGRPFFTSEDVWAQCAALEGHTIDPRRGSFLGALLREAAREHLIRLLPADLPSARPANHRRILRVWRSLVYDGPGGLPQCAACGQVLITSEWKG